MKNKFVKLSLLALSGIALAGCSIQSDPFYISKKLGGISDTEFNLAAGEALSNIRKISQINVNATRKTNTSKLYEGALSSKSIDQTITKNGKYNLYSNAITYTEKTNSANKDVFGTIKTTTNTDSIHYISNSNTESNKYSIYKKETKKTNSLSSTNTFIEQENICDEENKNYYWEEYLRNKTTTIFQPLSDLSGLEFNLESLNTMIKGKNNTRIVAFYNSVTPGTKEAEAKPYEQVRYENVLDVVVHIDKDNNLGWVFSSFAVRVTTRYTTSIDGDNLKTPLETDVEEISFSLAFNNQLNYYNNIPTSNSGEDDPQLEETVSLCKYNKDGEIAARIPLVNTDDYSKMFNRYFKGHSFRGVYTFTKSDIENYSFALSNTVEDGRAIAKIWNYKSITENKCPSYIIEDEVTSNIIFTEEGKYSFKVETNGDLTKLTSLSVAYLA